MINFADKDFIAKLVEAVNKDETFEFQARWFDGSILLEADKSQCWLKVYRGRVIDSFGYMPILGYTCKVSGPSSAWQMLLDGTRSFRDLTLPGKRHFEDDPTLSQVGVMTRDIAIEGNMMEANRIVGAIYALSNCIVKVLQKGG